MKSFLSTLYIFCNDSPREYTIHQGNIKPRYRRGLGERWNLELNKTGDAGDRSTMYCAF